MGAGVAARIMERMTLRFTIWTLTEALTRGQSLDVGRCVEVEQHLIEGEDVDLQAALS